MKTRLRCSRNLQTKASARIVRENTADGCDPGKTGWVVERTFAWLHAETWYWGSGSNVHP